MKISLITCVYNTEKYLYNCLSSIEKQTYEDFEVIIINDGSTDGSQRIINDFAKKDKRFKFVVQNNSGQAIARNKGIEIAKGEYIVFVDSDDEIKENYLLNLSKIIDKKLDLGFSKMTRVYEKKANILERNFKYIHAYDSGTIRVADHPEALTKIANSPCAKVYKRQFLIDNKIVFLPNKLYEDMLFMISLLLSNPSTMYIDDDSYIYNVHSGSSMTGNGKRAFEIFDVFDSIIEFSKNKNNYDFFREELEYLAIYHIAIGTMYRYFCYYPFGFFASLKKCRKYLKKNNYTIDNKYVSNMSVFTKAYLKLFFSYL